MSILPTQQPMAHDRESRRENGDAIPKMMVHDNNRGGINEPQTKGKVFQELQERYNNGQCPTHYPPYDPLAVEGRNGPFNY